MPLDWKIIGRRPASRDQTSVDVRWSDPSGAVVRPDLVAEAEQLEARAKALRADALFVPDQVDLPAADAGDDRVGAALEAKRADLERALGIGGAA